MNASVAGCLDVEEPKAVQEKEQQKEDATNVEPSAFKEKRSNASEHPMPPFMVGLCCGAQ